ncbi:hypothetical protein COV93_03635 [Candidatus Woesearchaeota archaeon CG11_big_fil_rev_8_21_14_0_20_43_8]|nr:MAG: hypothetical protein COV93_03635 [Candidatus Woesearchaeota archaeon CG11_big_fil_rev_8_21_14_0_20_43_8]
MIKGKIRQMKDSDLKRVSTLYQDANKFTTRPCIIRWSGDDFRRFPKYHFVFENEGKVIGGISGTLHRRNLGVVEDIAVDRKHRCNGIGDRLMKKLLDRFKENGITKVRLWIHWTDARAIPFYYKHGFKLKMFRHAHQISCVPDGEDILFLERIL